MTDIINAINEYYGYADNEYILNLDNEEDCLCD